jgi:hypothetical protein
MVRRTQQPAPGGASRSTAAGVSPSGVKPVPRSGGLRPDRGGSDGRSLVRTFAVAVFVWAFDFKSEASGSAAGFQAVMLGVYLASYLQITVAAEKRGARLGSLWALILATAAFMIDGSIMGLSLAQPPYAVLVNLIPPFIYISASALTYLTLEASADDLPSFLNVLRLACLTFAAVHIVVLVMTRGALNVTNSRFEVLSGAVIPSLGIAAVALIQPLSRLDVLVLVFNLGVTLLSVTRTLFAVLAAQIAVVFVVRPGAIVKASTIKGLILLALAAAVVVGLDLGAGTGLVGRWVDRLTVSSRVGADPTALTRSAETEFMMERFEASTDSMLFGNGMAAVTSLTGPDAERAAAIVGRRTVYIHGSGYGHESYASILFISGVIGGGWLLVMQLVNGLQAIGLMRRIQLGKSLKDESAAHIGAWGAIIVIGMLAFGFLAGTLGDRATCIWFGIGTGMLYWARKAEQASE